MDKRLGDVQVDVGGRLYTLRFGNRALGSLETQWSVKGLRELWRVGVLESDHVTLRQFAVAALQRYHPDLSHDDIGDLIDHMAPDGTRPFLEALAVAFQAIIPKAQAPTATEPPTASETPSA